MMAHVTESYAKSSMQCPLAFALMAATLRDETFQHVEWRRILCKGAMCMAWRWISATGDRGYCGLAGGSNFSRPETTQEPV